MREVLEKTLLFAKSREELEEKMRTHEQLGWETTGAVIENKDAFEDEPGESDYRFHIEITRFV